mmetsp:Transcript_124710/g.249006  ORF Transcript_124710/g.249006 Transcript_124710/m.249006 type:complete len:242 (+) Transcript_124710:1807-2532(+)
MRLPPCRRKSVCSHCAQKIWAKSWNSWICCQVSTSRHLWTSLSQVATAGSPLESSSQLCNLHRRAYSYGFLRPSVMRRCGSKSVGLWHRFTKVRRSCALMFVQGHRPHFPARMLMVLRGTLASRAESIPPVTSFPLESRRPSRGSTRSSSRTQLQFCPLACGRATPRSQSSSATVVLESLMASWSASVATTRALATSRQLTGSCWPKGTAAHSNSASLAGIIQSWNSPLFEGQRKHRDQQR